MCDVLVFAGDDHLAREVIQAGCLAGAVDRGAMIRERDTACLVGPDVLVETIDAEALDPVHERLPRGEGQLHTPAVARDLHLFQ